MNEDELREAELREALKTSMQKAAIYLIKYPNEENYFNDSLTPDEWVVENLGHYAYNCMFCDKHYDFKNECPECPITDLCKRVDPEEMDFEQLMECYDGFTKMLEELNDKNDD